MKKKDLIINISPFHCEVKVNSEGFALWFYDNIGNDFSRRKIVKIHLKNWWLKVIANMMWKVIKQRREDVAELERGMVE